MGQSYPVVQDTQWGNHVCTTGDTSHTAWRNRHHRDHTNLITLSEVVWKSSSVSIFSCAVLAALMSSFMVPGPVDTQGGHTVMFPPAWMTPEHRPFITPCGHTQMRPCLSWSYPGSRKGNETVGKENRSILG